MDHDRRNSLLASVDRPEDYRHFSPDDLKQLAWGGAFVLLAVVMFLNVGIRLLAGKRLVAAARAD
jgi:phosphate transport system permease protein